ncbi:Glycosyl transferase family 11 [Trinorchestia longiramus]|nr:Glycosyl transferase family 11 [Trinorchestia longiramus]
MMLPGTVPVLCVEFGVVGLLQAYHGYLRRAVSYFQRRHKNLVFVVTSDDLHNTSAIFADVGIRNVYVSNGTAPEDMCLLSLCQHNIITFGTFGFWAGYMSGGTTLYPHLKYPHAQYILTRELYNTARLSRFVPVPFYAK